MQTYNQLEYNHLTNKFYDPNDWVSSDLGYPSPGEICIVVYCSPEDDNVSWYSIAEYVELGEFKTYNKDITIQRHNVQAWKRLASSIKDLPY